MLMLIPQCLDVGFWETCWGQQVFTVRTFVIFLHGMRNPNSSLIGWSDRSMLSIQKPPGGPNGSGIDPSAGS